MSKHPRASGAIGDLALLLLSGLGWLALEITAGTDRPFNLPPSPIYPILALSLVVVPIFFLDLRTRKRPPAETDSANSKQEDRQTDEP
jgi:hypothetical protein